MVLHWTNLNPLHPRMHCARSGWNLSSGSGEEDFSILSMYFCYFEIFPPWKGRGPSFEQIWIPFTQGCFVPSLVENGPLVLGKNFVNVFSLFHNYVPLKKVGALHLNKCEFFLPKYVLCQVWLKLVKWLLRRRF